MTPVTKVEVGDVVLLREVCGTAICANAYQLALVSGLRITPTVDGDPRFRISLLNPPWSYRNAPHGWIASTSGVIEIVDPDTLPDDVKVTLMRYRMGDF